MTGLAVLGLLAALVSSVCWVLVLLKLFPDKGAGWGVFGFFCGIYTFIWGWQNVDRHNIKNIMTIWTAAFITSIVVQVLTLSMAART